MKTRFSLLLATSGVIAISACAPTTDQYGNTTGGMSKAQQGALAGAVAGGLIGAGESKDNAIKGAVIGGLAGAVGGSILDQQQKALQQSLNNPNIQIINNGKYLTVVMPESTLFATDSAAVGAQGQNDLYTIARNLTQYQNSRIQVIGHTDSTGSAAYNQDLSERRARSVSGILAAGGVASTRLTTLGRGATAPVASNDTTAGRAQNRRTEIVIIPNG